MPSTSQHGPGAELEIKLALPTADPASLARQLARLPALARRKPVRKQVDNIYFDTPAQALRAQRMALRLRRVGGDDAPQWLQTFKTSDGGDSALSLRGEWEVPVPGPALVQAALQAAPPWQRLDPEGAVFAALQPCFATAFERTAWTVRRRDGSVIEVALDLGQITSGQRSVPICELELELLAGAPTALFDLARHIALHIAVLPLAASKAQRGHALRDGTLDTPLRARPQPLGGDVAWHHMVQPVLGEMFAQFTANLNALRHCDDPELVHQARVGWRRFRGAVRLFKPAVPAQALPSWQGCAPADRAGRVARPGCGVYPDPARAAKRLCGRVRRANAGLAGHGAGVSPRRGAAAPGGAPCVAGAGGGLRLAGHHPVAGRSVPAAGLGRQPGFARKNRAPLGAPAYPAAACAMEKACATAPRRKPAPRAHSGQAPARYNIGPCAALAPARSAGCSRPAVRAGCASRDLLRPVCWPAAVGIVAFLRGYAAGRADVPWASQLPGSV
jgi:hypothetical protein